MAKLKINDDVLKTRKNSPKKNTSFRNTFVSILCFNTKNAFINMKNTREVVNVICTNISEKVAFVSSIIIAFTSNSAS